MDTVNMRLYLKKETEFLDFMGTDKVLVGLSYEECFNIYTITKLTNKLKGVIAEVGVYKGGSASIIRKFKDEKRELYLFDTFKGLADVDKEKDGMLFNGYANSKTSEKFLIQSFENDKTTHLIKGYFPDSIADNEKFNKKRFSFVHIDVDTYLSTLKSLEFFYPKMIKNGIILSHDYRNNGAPGVSKAIDEFFKDKKEHVVPLWCSQGMIIKI